MNAIKHSRALDLTKCALYTTGYPCVRCTEAVVKAGIKVIVYGRENNIPDTEKLIYKEKIFFQ